MDGGKEDFEGAKVCFQQIMWKKCRSFNHVTANPFPISRNAAVLGVVFFLLGHLTSTLGTLHLLSSGAGDCLEIKTENKWILETCFKMDFYR